MQDLAMVQVAFSFFLFFCPSYWFLFYSKAFSSKPENFFVVVVKICGMNSFHLSPYTAPYTAPHISIAISSCAVNKA